MSNDILNSLLKEYDQKKLKAELECDERKNNLYRLIPRLQEIDNELNSFAFKTAKNILNNSLLSDNSNNSYTVENLEEKIKNLKKEKEKILNENNLHDYINVSRAFDKYLTIDSTGVNTRRSGEYTIKVINRITGDVLKVPLSIVDTKDPQVEWNDYIPQILVGCSITADIFVKNAVDDAGIGKIYFYSEEGGRQSSFTPQSEGTYSVSVVVQDINNRKVSKEVSICAIQ